MAWLASIRLSPEQLEERRLAAFEMLQAGEPQVKIARELGVTTGAVNHWAKAANAGGIEALKRRPHTGRRPKLSRKQRESIPALLADGAEAHGFENDVWTTERVASLISQEFGIDYHPGHVWKLLQSLGLKWKKPKRQAHRRDEKAIQQWIQEEWPALKKGQRSSEQ